MSAKIALAAACLGLTAVLAPAHAQYPAFPYPANQPPPVPPSWHYDPYTSGLAPCPQWKPGDLTPCREQMPPSYGQPSYWSR